MNIIEQVSSLKTDFSNLMSVLKIVRHALSDANKEINLAGRTLRQANIEQSSLPAFYDEIRVHLQSVSNMIEIRLVERKAQLLRVISEQSKIDYGERLKEKLIEDDSGYIDLKIKKLEVDEVLELSKAIAERFKARGFSLRNISNLVVAQAQDEHLTLYNNDKQSNS